MESHQEKANDQEYGESWQSLVKGGHLYSHRDKEISSKSLGKGIWQKPGGSLRASVGIWQVTWNSGGIWQVTGNSGNLVCHSIRGNLASHRA